MERGSLLKKILLIHHSGSIGGAGLSFLHLVDSLPKNRFNLEIICPKHPTNMSNLLKEKGYKVIEVENSPKIFAHYNGGIKYAFSIRTFKNILDILKDKIKIESLIKESNPDILIVNSMTLFWIGRISKKLSVRSICFHRESYQRGLFGIRSKLIKYGLSNWFDKVVFISNYDLNATGKTNSIKSVVFDKVNINKYKNLNISILKKKLKLDNDYKYILYLGGISKLKGVYVILEAMKYLLNENVKLLFVSNINTRGSLKMNSLSNIKRIIQIKRIDNIIKKYQLNDRILFLNPTDKPEYYYKISDLVVFPSTVAHQARPIYEAGIAKKPIIISDFDNTKEFINNRAITFKKNDSLDLSKKIIEVIHKNTSDIVDNNYKYSLEQHNLKNMNKEISNLLEGF